VRSHVRASFAAPIQASDRRQVRIGLVCLMALGLVAFLGLGAPSAGAIDTCPNVVFRTGPSAKLPECRAYELVSPTYTGSQPPKASGFIDDLPGMFATDNVTPAGDSVVYNTIGGALSGFSGTGYVDRYRARRSAQGWVTEPISPGGDEMTLGGPGGISSDHEYAVGGANGGTEKLWPPFGGAGLQYLRTPEGYEPLARGSLGDAEGVYENRADWITPGATHVIFTSRTKLEPNAPETGAQAVYDRTPGGPTHVVSLLPDGKAAGSNFLGTTKDGTEVAFTPPGETPFYVRRDNAVTEEVVRRDGVVVGKELKCAGGPGSATLSYRWLRNGTEIGGASSSTYTITSADEGSVVQCQVTASNSQGTSLITSATRLVDPYQGKSFPTTNGFAGEVSVAPSASTAAVGTLLTCNGGVGSGFTFEYQWLSDGTEIGGATSSTYTPVEADAGHSIQCRVAVSNSNGTSLSYSSPIAVTKAAPKASADPSISNLTDPGNAPGSGDELSCSQGTWSASPSFAYQWLRDGEEIATASTYTVEAGDDGKALQCRVTATSGGASTQAVSKQVYFTTAGPSGETHPFLETFGSASQPSFGNAEGLAVDQSTGDLLVIDSSARTVSRWKPDGTPDDFSALGTNVIDGQGTGDGTPQSRLSFGAPNEVQVAVDNSGTATDGDIYVSQAQFRLVDVFASSGAYLGQITGYDEGPSAEGPIAQLGESCGVAVDSNGAVYVGDTAGENGGVHKYVPNANPPANVDSTANFGYPSPCTLAAGAGPSAGFIFATEYYGQQKLAKLDSSSGEEKYALPNEVTTVSVDPTSGHVYAVKGSELQEFDASGASSASTVSLTNLSGGSGVAVRGSSGNVYASKAGSSTVSVYGPAVPAFPEPPEQLTTGEIFGSAQVGNSLFCGTGNWSGNPIFTFQWLRNGNEIGGATESSHALTAEDLGTVVQCRVTATNANGRTVAINAGEGANVVASGPPQASASLSQSGLTFDGIFNGRVFYSDGPPSFNYYSSLGNLYTYDLNTEETSTIVGTGNAAIVNISEDGSHVYFVSQSPINGEGEAGKPNLGVWSAANENAKFIATVAEGDIQSSGFNQEPGLTTWPKAISPNVARDVGRSMDHSRTTPDGTVFAFETTAQLSAFDNTEASPADCGVKPESGQPNSTPGEHCDEVYRYDAESEELTCVSCGPGSGPATGNARLQTIEAGGGLVEAEVGPASVNSPVESLTADGDTVFFESTEGLLPQDGNETKDVYRWEKGGGVALISTGQSTSESALYGVTPSGSDVILATREKLLPEDENGSTTRLYDARVGGGFPPPEETVTEPCSGDACQGQAAAAPEPPNDASSSLNGGGNVPGKAKCARHSRRVVRNGSERCVHRKHHHKHRRAHDKRRAAR
jgi:hypothetical protein